MQNGYIVLIIFINNKSNKNFLSLKLQIKLRICHMHKGECIDDLVVDFFAFNAVSLFFFQFAEPASVFKPS